MSGAPVHHKNVELVRYIHTKSEGKLPIIGVGGIMSGADAQDMIDAGASLVEIYSGFIYEGPALVKKIIKHFEKNSVKTGAQRKKSTLASAFHGFYGFIHRSTRFCQRR